MNSTLPSGKRKILIIDDDPIVAGVYRTKFEQSGFDVRLASDGQEGFYMVMENTPHAILLDLMLPMMKGTELIRKFRAQKRFEKLPIFVLTNSFLDNLAFEASQAGANQVFNKTGTPPQEIIQSVIQSLTYQGQPGMPQGYPQGWGSEMNGRMPPPGYGGFPPGYPMQVGYQGYPPQGFPQGVPNPYPAPPPPAAPPVVPPTPANLPPKAPQEIAPPSRIGNPQPTAPARTEPTPARTEPTPAASMNESHSTDKLRKEFFSFATQNLSDMRKLLSRLSKTDIPEDAQPTLQELGAMVHKFTGSAAVLELPHIAQIGSALEALLRELREKPKSFNPSTKRTTALALDALNEWIQKGPNQKYVDPSEGRILVVDDEVISRKAVVRAMEKTRLACEGMDSPEAALEKLETEHWDLVILDVDMPGTDGFEVCSQIRRSSRNNKVPVIFVTGMNSFESRTKSMLSGGTDFIGKPFVFIELGLKALIHLTRALMSEKN